jgi:hypothetical protein
MGGGVSVEQIISTSDIDKARKQLRNKEFHSETDPSEAGEGSDQGSIRVVPHRLPPMPDVGRLPAHDFGRTRSGVRARRNEAKINVFSVFNWTVNRDRCPARLH